MWQKAKIIKVYVDTDRKYISRELWVKAQKPIYDSAQDTKHVTQMGKLFISNIECDPEMRRFCVHNELAWDCELLELLPSFKEEVPMITLNDWLNGRID